MSELGEERNMKGYRFQDEIRISVLGKVPPLTKALRRMRG